MTTTHILPLLPLPLELQLEIIAFALPYGPYPQESLLVFYTTVQSLAKIWPSLTPYIMQILMKHRITSSEQIREIENGRKYEWLSEKNKDRIKICLAWKMVCSALRESLQSTLERRAS
jgi:hypothetical protein